MVQLDHVQECAGSQGCTVWLSPLADLRGIQEIMRFEKHFSLSKCMEMEALLNSSQSSEPSAGERRVDGGSGGKCEGNVL